MILTVHPVNPEKRKIDKIVSLLRDNDGVVVLPTDSIYGIMVATGNKKGLDRIFRIKKMPRNQHLSIICSDIEMASHYARGISNQIFRLMRRVLPGPYTLIFQATREVPKILQNQKGTIGIRIPDNKILQAVIEELQAPLISTSVHLQDKWYNDPAAIDLDIGKQVDLVVDGGIFPVEPSTIIDAQTGDPILVRQGKGILDIL